MATITPEGDEVPSYDGYVTLYEHDPMGVGCIATVEGALVPPIIHVLVDDKVYRNTTIYIVLWS